MYDSLYSRPEVTRLILDEFFPEWRQFIGHQHAFVIVWSDATAIGRATAYRWYERATEARDDELGLAA